MPTQAGPVAMAALRVEGLRVVAGRRVLLDSVDLHVEPGVSLAVVGPSGSGKTTLLMVLAGVVEASGGTVRVGGTDLTKASSKVRAAVRLRQVGIVYQFGELLPELTPIENVALPALMARTGRDEAFGRAAHLLGQVEMAGLADAVTGTLSGGERQRVAVARALVNRPSLILADEPTGALDRETTSVVADLLFSLPASEGCGLIVVTHNEVVAARAGRRVELVSGALVAVER